MNLSKLARLLLVGLVLTVAVTGCKKRPTPLTVLPPGGRSGPVQDPTTGGILDPSRSGLNNPGVSGRDANFSDTNQNQGIAFTGPGHDNWIPNTEIFKQYTVHFGFDSSAISSSEQAKIASVADALKGQASAAIRIEGHCDERGTEEYNRALGERRALAIREEIVRLGIDASRVDTISYGKDRPVDPGHSEAAWKLNRRGEFILLTPPSS